MGLTHEALELLQAAVEAIHREEADHVVAPAVHGSAGEPPRILMDGPREPPKRLTPPFWAPNITEMALQPACGGVRTLGFASVEAESHPFLKMDS